MTLTRRQFFKLAAAGAAVALVPIATAEEAVSVLTPERAAKLWEIRASSVYWGPYDRGQLWLTLRRGSWHIDLRMYVDKIPTFGMGDGVELDVAEIGRTGRFVAVVDGKELDGVHHLDIACVRDTIRFENWKTGMIEHIALPVEGNLDDLTLSKQMKRRRNL